MSQNQRGDTIIEVLLATVVISIVIAGAYTLTNRATRLNQTAQERTIVSNIMREQIELIRGARTADSSAVWQAIRTRANSTAPNYSTCSSNSASSFYVNPDLNDYNNASFVINYANNTNYSPHFRAWVQPYRPAGVTDYIDFHVRVCWPGIGDAGEQSSALVMRIAE